MLPCEAAVSCITQGVNCVWDASYVEPVDSEQLMEVSYNTMSGSMRIIPDQSFEPLTPGPKETNTSCFLVFDGVSLTEDGLKDWLRLCAKPVNV